MIIPRPTGRGITLLGLAAATYFAGRLVGTWELYLFAFAFLAVVVVCWILVIFTGQRVKVERSLLPERPVAGDEVEFSFQVMNRSLLPGPQLTLRSRLEAMCPTLLEIEVEGLGPRGTQRVEARCAPAMRGVHTLPPVQALAEDPLGIAAAVHQVSESQAVTVYPRIVSLESCALFPEIGLRHDWTGHHGLASPGSSEFRGIRPHQPGEPLSHIDWKSTAKTGVLMLREMDDPAGNNVTLLLDGTASQVVGGLPETNFELAVRAAGSVGDFAIRANRSVSLLCHEHNWRAVRMTPDGGGRRLLLDTLAQTAPSAGSPLVKGVRHLRASRSGLLQAESVAVIAISLDRQLVSDLLALRHEGVRLAFLYVVGASFHDYGRDHGTASLLPFLPSKRRDRASDATPSKWAEAMSASRYLSTDERALLLSLSSAGIPCLSLTAGDDLAQSLSLWPGDRDQRRYSAGKPR